MTRLGMRYLRNVTYRGIDVMWLEIGREKWMG